MTYLQSILLGILQGVTEFIPVSSSGHLVLAPYLLGWSIDPGEAFVFDVLVQVATLAAVIIYFWKDLTRILQAVIQGLLKGKPFQELDARLGWYLVLATVPAGTVAVLFKDTFEAAFSNPRWAASFLLVTAGLLFLAEVMQNKHRTLDQIGWVDAVWIGFFQVLALFPGISRSGSTISGGLTRHLDRPSAARFSFLMAVPVMLAAGGLALVDLFSMPGWAARFPVYLAGFASAALVGYLSIRWLLRYLAHHSLLVFAVYCTLLGSGILIEMAIK